MSTKTKRRKPIKTTQLSLKHFRDIGYEAHKTEHWNSWARIRQDLLGFGDLLVFGFKQIILVQVTSQPNMGPRRKKIIESKQAKRWVKAGGRIVLHGWQRKVKKGFVRPKFVLHEEDLTLNVLVNFKVKGMG